MSLPSAWSTEWVSGQPGLRIQMLSQNKKQTNLHLQTFPKMDIFEKINIKIFYIQKERALEKTNTPWCQLFNAEVHVYKHLHLKKKKKNCFESKDIMLGWLESRHLTSKSEVVRVGKDGWVWGLLALTMDHLLVACVTMKRKETDS